MQTKIGILALTLILPLVALAHGDSASYEAMVGEYMVDVGYPTASPQQGEVIPFDFQLRKGESKVDFSDVWITITDEKGTAVLATGVHTQSFGGARLSYVFPGPGSYTVSVRYEKGTDVIAESTFPMTVMAGESPYRIDPLSIVIGLVLGSVLAFAARKIRR